MIEIAVLEPDLGEVFEMSTLGRVPSDPEAREQQKDQYRPDRPLWIQERQPITE